MNATVMRHLKNLERAVDAVFLPKNPAWWLWPVFLFVGGAGAVLLSLVFGPGEGERVDFWGHRFGEPCGFYVTTGHPCPQCGMTRSWIWAIRGDVVRSFFYNPAGATLFWWLVAAGAIGGIRLVTRNPKALRVPSNVLLAWTITWLLALYLLPWLGRVLLGLNPLPPPIAPA